MAKAKKAQEGVQSLLAVAHRAPLEEPGCRAVDVVKELLTAACKGELEFAQACSNHGLVQYGTNVPSDVGIVNLIQPLLDCAFHSRKHREAEAKYAGELAYREEMRVRDEAQRVTERRIEVMDRVDARYRCGSVASIDAGLFAPEVSDE